MLLTTVACDNDNSNSEKEDYKKMMTEKKNIGNKLALYPMPVTVIGAEVNGKLDAHRAGCAHNVRSKRKG